MATSLQRDQRSWLDREDITAGKPEQPSRPNRSTIETIHEDQEGRNMVIDTTSLYFSEISHFPLLTHQEEIELAKRVELGQQAQSILTGTEYHDDRAELERIISDGLSAKNTLWERNCRLVASVARRYINKGVPFDDLIQEGNLGLEHATIRFDWRKGFKFSTYAYWWIRQSVTRFISGHSRIVRIPSHKIEFMARVFKASEELQQIHNSEVNASQIAAHMGVTTNLVEEAFRLYYSAKSLDDSSREDDDMTTYNYIPGDELTEEIGEQKHLRHEVSSKLLSNLTDRERMIIELRYGIADGEEHTLAYVANELGISRERVRQIEAAVLAKLRSAASKAWFTEYL